MSAAAKVSFDYACLSDVTSILNEESSNEEQRSTETKTETYFDKLLRVAGERQQSSLTTGTTSSPSDDQFTDGLESLMESIRISKLWASNDSKTGRSQEEVLLLKLKELKEMNVHKQLEKRRISISTLDGDVHFDFSEQSINGHIYLRLMQLVRLSNLDALIEKMFHKSGEYHDIDYKKHREDQLEKDQDNYSIKTEKTSLARSDLTMARAVHFRALSHCFELDGIDISSRFQYDRNILHDTCLRFHPDVDISLNTAEKRKTSTQSNIHRILVLCSCQMQESYQSLNVLLQSYKSPNISIVYVTFDQLEPILTQSNPMSPETVQENTSESFDSSSEQCTVLNTQNSLTHQEITPSELSDSNMNNETSSFITPEGNALSDYIRTSSLVLIMMKHLDETYLNTLIQLYHTIDQLNTDLQLSTDWNEFMTHWWLITSDYQHAKTLYSISETNLFLWPTELDNFDNTSIILSSILALPIALSINYNIYSMVLDGISTIDKHCREAASDRNICIQMALSRIWSSFCERRKRTTAVITCDDDLQEFGEYIRILLTEYDDISKNKLVDNYTAIHGISSAERFLEHEFNEQNHLSCDIISSDEEKIFSLLTNSLQTAKSSFPHTRILLDQMTPLTIGVLIGAYQMSIFIENYLRNELKITSDLGRESAKE